MNTSELIALAWCDKTTWNDIKQQTGLTEDEVMLVMKANLKPKSYIVWRRRVKKYKKQN